MANFVDAKLVSGRSTSTTSEYDNLNRRTKRTLPMGFFETYTYDDAGNMLTRRNFNGKTTTYGYDTRNRVTSITPDPTLGGTPTTFTYTFTGKRQTMTDASGATTYTYDNRDRLKTKATPQGTLTYTYGGTSNVTSVVSSNTNGVNIGYAYDTLNRLSTVTDNNLASVQATYTYDDVSKLATVTYPNGVVHTYGDDAKKQLTSLTVNRGATALASYGYTYGFAAQKLTASELNGRARDVRL